jgi:hypothetical protein
MKAIGLVSGSRFREPKRTQWTLIVAAASKPYRVGLGMPILTNGRKASLISNSFPSERVTAEYRGATGPTTAIGWVSGSRFREPTRTRWTLIVVNASKHCQHGPGTLFPIDGRKASLISNSFPNEWGIVEF